MSNLQTTIEQVHALARQYRGVLELADYLKEHASVEQAISEAHVQYSAMLVTVKEKRDEVAGWEAKIAAAKQVHAEAQAKTRAHLAAAKAEAEDIVRLAKQQAATVHVAAEQRRDAFLAKGEVAQTELNILTTKIADARSTLDALERQIKQVKQAAAALAQ
jgi:chromosome segregation ATPase